jgi:hypothetical protein
MMPDQSEVGKKEATREAFALARKLRSESVPEQRIAAACEAAMLKGGVDPTTAADMAQRMSQAPDESTSRTGEGIRSIIIGLAAIGVAILITAGTYMLAARGGVYVVAIGPFAFGAYYIVKGLMDLGTHEEGPV